MRFRPLVLPALALVLVALVALAVQRRVWAHMMFIRGLYRVPGRLKQDEWNYDKADLPSARIRHPVLEGTPWWRSPQDDWLRLRESWPERLKKRIPTSIKAMESALEEMRRRARANAEEAMRMTEKEIARYAPPQTPIEGRRNYCPHCEKGPLVWVGPGGWDEVRCGECGTTFPNERYPADKKNEVKGAHVWPFRGTLGVFWFHRDKHDFFHFFEALTYAPKRRKAMEWATALATAYHVTGEDRYARRAAVILEAFSKVYPAWAVSNSEHPLQFQSVGAIPRKETTYLFDTWLSGVPYEQAQQYEPVYDRIYHSPALDRLSEERGHDIREAIERDLFYHNLVFYLSNVAPFGGSGKYDPGCMLGVARKARILNDAELIHRCHHWAELAAHSKYRRDGSLNGPILPDEGIDEGVLKVVSEIEGWTDPEGHVDQWGGHRFDDYTMARDFPIAVGAAGARDVLRCPDGRSFPANDAAPSFPAAWREARSRILPSWGHAVLGAGFGEDAVECRLHFPAGAASSHRDALQMTLFAGGREALSDIGGRRSSVLRDSWIAHTASHNTVVVDRRAQSLPLSGPGASTADCELMTFVSAMPGMSLVEARAERRYPGLATTYRRMLIHVTIDPRHPYVVDVFHVVGGSIHDYMLHGSVDHAQTLDVNLDMTEAGARFMEGLDVTDAGRSTYELFAGVRGAETEGGWRASFTYPDAPDAGVRVHMLGGRATEVFTAATPSCRRTPRRPGAEVDYRRPTVIARRRGPAGLDSVFVSVIEPRRGGHHVMSVERLKTTTGGAASAALRIRSGSRVDTVLVACDGPGHVVTTDGYELRGRAGIISETKQGPAAVYLVGGTRVAHAGLALEQESGSFEGEIVETKRTAAGDPVNALVTNSPLPEGDTLRGSWITLAHGPEMSGSTFVQRLPLSWLRYWRDASPGRPPEARRRSTVSLEIDHVERRDGSSWIHLTTPAGIGITRRGLRYEVFRGKWQGLPDLSGLRPDASGIVNSFDWAPCFEQFDLCYRLTGVIEIPRDGRYAFTLSQSPKAGRLMIDDAVVFEARPGDRRRKVEGTLELAAGKHPVVLVLVQGERSRWHDLLWTGPLIEQQSVPASACFLRDVITDEIYAPQRRFAGRDGFRITRSSCRILGAPSVEPDGGLVPGDTTVSIDAGSSSGFAPDEIRIRYTLDGSEPDARSRLYEGAFDVGGTTTVKARAFAPGWASATTSATSVAPRTPDATPGEMMDGLAFRYWEFEGGPLVDFRSRPPLARGVAKEASLDPVLRPSGRPRTDFAIEFSGFVRVPIDGLYTFATFSEGPSRVEIGETRVVEHILNSREPTVTKGVIALRSGLHKIRVTCVSGGDGDARPKDRAFRLGYTGPEGLSRDEIRFVRPADRVAITPASGVFDGPVAVTITPESRRADVRVTFDGAEPTTGSRRYRRPFWLREPGVVKACVVRDGACGPTTSATWFAPKGAVELVDGATASGLIVTYRGGVGATPSGAGRRVLSADTVSFAEARAGPFSRTSEGYLLAGEDGVYTFHLSSRDECALRIDGEMVVTSSNRATRAGRVALRAGAHAFRVDYVKEDATPVAALTLEYEGPGVERARIPRGVLRRDLDIVRFETDDERFYGIATVELVPEREGLPVRYTLDATDPTAASELYAAPLVLKDTTTIRARVFPEGRAAGGVVSSMVVRRLELRPPDGPAEVVSGVGYEYFEGESWTRLPRFAALTPVAFGRSKRFDKTPARRKNQFALLFKGFVRAPADGLYVFRLNSDDGSRLYIGDELVVDNDGEHPREPGASGRVALGAGMHAVKVSYFVANHGNGLEVSYEGPGIPRRVVPPEILFTRP